MHDVQLAPMGMPIYATTRAALFVAERYFGAMLLVARLGALRAARLAHVTEPAGRRPRAARGPFRLRFKMSLGICSARAMATACCTGCA